MAGTLAEIISAAIAAHDPLDPWLVQSNYDEHYWDQEAERIASLVERARSEEAVYALLVDVLRPLVRSPETDEYVRARLERAAASVWRWLQARPD